MGVGHMRAPSPWDVQAGAKNNCPGGLHPTSCKPGSIQLDGESRQQRWGGCGAWDMLWLEGRGEGRAVFKGAQNNGHAENWSGKRREIPAQHLVALWCLSIGMGGIHQELPALCVPSPPCSVPGCRPVPSSWIQLQALPTCAAISAPRWGAGWVLREHIPAAVKAFWDLTHGVRECPNPSLPWLTLTGAHRACAQQDRRGNPSRRCFVWEAHACGTWGGFNGDAERDCPQQLPHGFSVQPRALG